MAATLPGQPPAQAAVLRRPALVVPTRSEADRSDEPGDDAVDDDVADADGADADGAAFTRRDDEFRLRRGWRVDVSYGRWVDPGLSCRAHHSVLL